MCVLRASGGQFDVDEFMRDSKLSPYQVFHKGERLFPNSSRNKTCSEVSCLTVDVSKREWDDLPGQIGDAIGFLRRFHDELQRLVSFAGVEDVGLDFPHDLRIGRHGVALQCYHLPSSLLREAGNLGVGIELSLYPAEGETDEPGDHES